MTTYEELNTALGFEDKYLPQGRFYFIKDKLESDGNFLIHHFLNLFLNQKKNVALVSFNQTFFHFNSIEQKLVNFSINNIEYEPDQRR
jgi:hypothetical protein